MGKGESKDCRRENIGSCGGPGNRCGVNVTRMSKLLMREFERISSPVRRQLSLHPGEYFTLFTNHQ